LGALALERNFFRFKGLAEDLVATRAGFRLACFLILVPPGMNLALVAQLDHCYLPKS
jgi:hypothetical protein